MKIEIDILITVLINEVILFLGGVGLLHYVKLCSTTCDIIFVNVRCSAHATTWPCPGSVVQIQYSNTITKVQM